MGFRVQAELKPKPGKAEDTTEVSVGGASVTVTAKMVTEEKK